MRCKQALGLLILAFSDQIASFSLIIHVNHHNTQVLCWPFHFSLKIWYNRDPLLFVSLLFHLFQLLNDRLSNHLPCKIPFGRGSFGRKEWRREEREVRKKEKKREEMKAGEKVEGGNKMRFIWLIKKQNMFIVLINKKAITNNSSCINSSMKLVGLLSYFTTAEVPIRLCVLHLFNTFFPTLVLFHSLPDHH